MPSSDHCQENALLPRVVNKKPSNLLSDGSDQRDDFCCIATRCPGWGVAVLPPDKNLKGSISASRLIVKWGTHLPRTTSIDYSLGFVKRQIWNGRIRSLAFTVLALVIFGARWELGYQFHKLSDATGVTIQESIHHHPSLGYIANG